MTNLTEDNINLFSSSPSTQSAPLSSVGSFTPVDSKTPTYVNEQTTNLSNDNVNLFASPIRSKLDSVTDDQEEEETTDIKFDEDDLEKTDAYFESNIPQPKLPPDEADDAWYLQTSTLPEDITYDRVAQLQRDNEETRRTISEQALKQGISEDEFIEKNIIPNMPDGDFGSSEQIVKSLLSASGATGFRSILNISDWINEGIGGLGNKLEEVARYVQKESPDIYRSITSRSPASLANQLVRDTMAMVEVAEAATMGVVTAGSLGFKTTKKLQKEMSQLEFNKFYEAPKKFVPNVRGITYQAMTEADELAEKTAKQNSDLMEQLLDNMQKATGKTLSKVDEETGKLVPDPEAYRKAGIDVLNDMSPLERLEDLGETRKDEFLTPILKIEKFNAVVSMASVLKDKYPKYFDKDTPIIDSLFNATVDEKLVGDPEFMKELTKYNIDFEEYILAVVGSGSKAGQVLNRLSQIRRATSLSAKEAKEERKALDQQDGIRKYIIRIENIRRGLLVSQFKTAARNLTSAYIRGPLEGLQNVFDTVLYNLANEGKGKAALSLVDPVNWSDSFRHMKYMFSDIENVKDYTDFILDNPKLGNLHTMMFEQVSEIRKSLGSNTKSPAVNKMFEYAEDSVDFLNTPNRFQEFLTRRAVFMGELERLVKREYGVNLMQELNKGRLPDFINDAIRPEGARSFYEIAADATTRALDVTFAKSPDVPIFKEAANFVVKNGLTVAFEFPRFTFNSLELMGQYSGGAAYALVKKLTTGKGFADAKQRQRVTRNLVGAAAILGAYQYRTSENAPEDYKLIRTSDKEGVNVTPQYPLRQFLYVGEMIKQFMEGGSDQLADFLTSDFGAEGLETYIGAPLRRGVGEGITQEIGEILFQDGRNVLMDNKLAKAGGKALAQYLQTFFVPMAQIVDLERGTGYRGSVKKDVATDPKPGQGGVSAFTKEFIRPFRQQAIFMSPKEEEGLPERTDLYGRNTRIRNMERAFLGLGYEELPNEAGKMLQSFGIKSYKLASKSQIPSLKREENKFLAKHIPSLVATLNDSKDLFEKLYDRRAKAKVGFKETMSKEQFVKEHMKDKFLKFYAKLKSSFVTGYKEVAPENRLYIIALEKYRKLSRQEKKMAVLNFRYVNGREPDIHNEEDIIALTKTGKVK